MEPSKVPNFTCPLCGAAKDHREKFCDKCWEEVKHEVAQKMGHKGGSKTSVTHGPEHYQKIGKKGGARVKYLVNKAKNSE